jgi:hypothetical protein
MVTYVSMEDEENMSLAEWEELLISQAFHKPIGIKVSSKYLDLCCKWLYTLGINWLRHNFYEDYDSNSYNICIDRSFNKLFLQMRGTNVSYDFDTFILPKIKTCKNETDISINQERTFYSYEN